MNDDVRHGEVVDDNEETMLDAGTALSAMARAEIDIQISTAKRYPRSLTKFKKQSMEMATLDEEVAATMFYVLPRGGKKIEGPSARLAEVVGSTWGNLRYGARIVAIGDKFLTAEGACHDLETNNAAKVEIQRRITGKDGKRFNDDMIGVTANAACSIALRQAIFKVVPFAFVKPIYDAARLCSIGKAKSMANKRAAAIEWFSKAGVSEADVLTFLDKQGIEEITDDDLITLRGVVQAIKDGDMTIEEIIGKEARGGKKVADSSLNEKLAPKTNGNSNHLSLESLKEELSATKSQGRIADLRKQYIAGMADDCEPEIIRLCEERAADIKGAKQEA